MGPTGPSTPPGAEATWQPLPAGRWNRVWSTDDGRTVVKRYADPGRAENEAAALRLLAESDVPAPRLRSVRVEAGGPVLTMTAVPGVAPRAEAVARLAPAVLRPVHAIRGGWYGRLAGAARSPSWRAYLTARIACYLGHLDGEPGLRSRLRTSEFTDLPAQVAPSCPQPRLLHNDLHPAHFIGTPPRVALVDWEHSVFGDPLFDYARLGFRLGLPAGAVVRLVPAPAADHPPVAPLLHHYRRIALLAHVSLGVRRPATDPHRILGLRALAELSGDATEEGTGP